MSRKRVCYWLAALVLALNLVAAPNVWASNTAPVGPAGLWSSVQAWVQDLLGDWLGWVDPEPNSTYYDAATIDQTDAQPSSPDRVGPGAATTDEGPDPDPNG